MSNNLPSVSTAISIQAINSQPSDALGDLTHVSIQAPVLATHNIYLTQQTSQFRSRSIPWEVGPSSLLHFGIPKYSSQSLSRFPSLSVFPIITINLYFFLSSSLSFFPLFYYLSLSFSFSVSFSVFLPSNSSFQPWFLFSPLLLLLSPP